MNDRKTLEEREQMSDLDRLRHSCAHIMATAILRIWPEAQFAYGPPGEYGFYYDFDMKHRVTPDDFPAMERYGGGLAFIETWLTTMRLLPE